MKYIRTKEEIILNPAPLDCGNCEFGIYMGEDAKQADTIEELCDEFVIVCKDSSLNRTFQNLKEARIAGSYFECNHEYYGAIWTDKGLIYVAKMNDKGELELL